VCPVCIIWDIHLNTSKILTKARKCQYNNCRKHFPSVMCYTSYAAYEPTTDLTLADIQTTLNSNGRNSVGHKEICAAAGSLQMRLLITLSRRSHHRGRSLSFTYLIISFPLKINQSYGLRGTQRRHLIDNGFVSGQNSALILEDD
jgi:hypothetical protein